MKRYLRIFEKVLQTSPESHKSYNLKHDLLKINSLVIGILFKSCFLSISRTFTILMYKTLLALKFRHSVTKVTDSFKKIKLKYIT